MKHRPKVLSIAGFDPSGGAGVLADAKVFEQHKVLGMAILTANTIQTENVFEQPNWINENEVVGQLKLLLAEHQFKYIKIGLIPSFSFLDILLDNCIEANATSKIIWDPILSTSSGFDFGYDVSSVAKILKKIYIVTPNLKEVTRLAEIEDAQKAAAKLSKHTKVFLKGGHSLETPGRDYLFSEDKVFPFRGKGKGVSPKHGSGCVLSSALCANLALGFPLIKACLKAKSYTTNFLESNPSLLGYHK